jgi:fructosamine-3-kinase
MLPQIGYRHRVDLAYLRAHPHQLPTFRKHQRIRETPVSGGDIADAARLTLDDGSSVFAKTWPSGSGPVPPGFFAAEAAGLTWLAVPDGPPVPSVIAALDDMIVMDWVDPGRPSARAAEDFGRALAALHRSGAPGFGADWPAYIGRLPLSNTPSPGPWPAWFAEHRLAPYLKISADRRALSTADVTLIDQLINTIDGYVGPAGREPPARLHGDLWPGNLLWAADGRVWLVDPAAHGGHRETDLALLALFGGAPFLNRILGAYHEVWPLAEGWRQRVPLHQLFLLLVHTATFGEGYRGAVRAAARASLSGTGATVEG